MEGWRQVGKNPFCTRDDSVCAVLGTGKGSAQRLCLDEAEIEEADGN